VPVVLPIPLAVAAAAVVVAEAAATAAEVASTMVVCLLDTTCASQSETRISGVAVNVGSHAKGDSPFYLLTWVTGATTINV
jgi:hypothetical protein